MSRYKILHVDDDRDIRDLAYLALAEIGDLNVLQCSSGADALSALAEFAPDLILLDVMMPGLSGEETFEKIRDRKEHAHVPIIFVTAKGDHDVRDRLIQLGAADVVTKPFDPITLAGRLKAIIET